jgi:hypothetical protein
LVFNSSTKLDALKGNFLPKVPPPNVSSEDINSLGLLFDFVFNSRVPSGTLCLLLPSPLKRSLKEMNDSYIFNQFFLFF